MDATPLLRPLIPLLVAQIAGIVLGERLAGYAYPALIATVCALLFSFSHLSRRRISLTAPLILICACGYLSIQPWTAPPADPEAIANYARGEPVTVTGTIVGEPTPMYQRTRVVMAAEHIVSDTVDTSVQGNLQITVGGTDLGLQRGDRLRCQGRLKPITNFYNPGGFDYERFMRFRQIRCRMWSAPQRVQVLTKTCARGPYHLDSLRRRIVTFIDAHAQADAAAVLKALVVGDRSGVSNELREGFNRVGVAHLLAISGLHVGMVATVAVTFFRFVLTFVPALLNRGWVFKGAALAALPLVVAYGFVAGMSPSTQRAVLMISVVLLALVWGKQPDPFSTVALAGMVILTIFPPALFSISFQLSFSAVGFIILGLFPFHSTETEPAPNGPGRWIVKRAAALAWISLLAYAGTLPLIMFYFNRVSLIGLAANMIFVPLFGLLVVPVGLLAAFLGLFWPTLFGWVIDWNACVLELALMSIKALAKWPPAAVYTITPNLLEIGCYYILAVIAVWRLPTLIAWLRGYRLPAGRRPHTPILTKVAVAMALLLLAVDAGYWHFQRHFRNDLRMTVLSVGDGSATLLELPKGRVMLVDGGGFTDNAIFDVGQRIVAPALWRKKIRTIDVMVLSHPNSDHLNGLLFVARHFKVGQLWTNGETQDTAAYVQFRQIVAQRAIVEPEFETLARRHDFGTVQVQIVWPPADFKQYTDAHPHDEPNNNSIVLRVAAGDTAMVLPGDIEGAAERAIVARGTVNLQSDVLVAPHHGSRTSSTERFLRAVRPETVIVSCAAMGRYRFPHPTVAARYRQNGLRVFSTADNGAIAVIAQKGDIKVLPTAATKP